MYFSIINIETNRPTLKIRRAAAQALMRSLLVKHYGFSKETSSSVEISRMASGKPYLKAPGIKDLPSISISHSGPWIACLVASPHVTASIDIEDLTKKRSTESIALHYFFPQEIDYVKTKGDLGFFQIWTAKEAISKCLGQGLGTVLNIDLSHSLRDNALISDVNYEDMSYALVQGLTPFKVFYSIATLN